MSIWLYTGTPGSGKSFHASKDIVLRLKKGGGLICNFPVNVGVVKKCKAGVEYWDNSEMSPQRLARYAMEHHVEGKEGQTLVIIDECQILFNCRDLNAKDRKKWIELFSQHRKLGFDFILITQLDRMIDRQIRGMVETEVKHRKLNNFGMGGAILSILTGLRTWFIALEYWYGGNKLLMGKQVFCFKKMYSKVYDSYRLFSDLAGLAGDGDGAGCPVGGVPEPAPAPNEAEKAGEEAVAPLIT